MDLESLPKKSIWKESRARATHFYCPNCRVRRVMKAPLNPGTIAHYLQIGLTSVVFTLLTWPLFGVKGAVSFVPIWALFEAVYRVKNRATLACTECGFDPFLYKIDVDRARKTIEDHWRKKFEEKGLPFPDPKDPKVVAEIAKRKKATSPRNLEWPLE